MAFTLKDNTVESKNQLGGAKDYFYLGDEKCDFKILILGNSITRHTPKSEIGWELDCGMAASATDKDYVHVLFSLLKKSGLNPYIKVMQVSEWEINFETIDIKKRFSAEKEFNANIVIFRIGENVKDATREKAERYKTCLEEFTNFLKGENTEFIFSTCFWEYTVIDAVVKELSVKYGKLVLLGDLGADENMRATGKFWHKGVAGHPGDAGMKEIANRIFCAIIDIMEKNRKKAVK